MKSAFIERLATLVAGKKVSLISINDRLHSNDVVGEGSLSHCIELAGGTRITFERHADVAILGTDSLAPAPHWLEELRANNPALVEVGFDTLQQLMFPTREAFIDALEEPGIDHRALLVKMIPDDWEFAGTVWAGVDLSHLDLTALNLNGADLSDCRAENTQFPNLVGTTLARIDAPGTKFKYMKQCDLNGATFQHTTKFSKMEQCNLDDADLSACNLMSVQLNRCTLRNAKLPNARLEHLNARQCDFTNADFQGADLFAANLSNSTLNSANFRHAILHSARLGKCDVTGADFTDAQQTKLKLTKTDPRSALGLSPRKMPLAGTALTAFMEMLNDVNFATQCSCLATRWFLHRHSHQPICQQ